MCIQPGSATSPSKTVRKYIIFSPRRQADKIKNYNAEREVPQHLFRQTLLTMDVHALITPATSARSAGMIIVLLALARLPN